MTILDDLHSQHKERLARMGGVARSFELPAQPSDSRNEKIDKVLAGFSGMEARIAQLEKHSDVLRALVGKFITTEADETPRFGEIIDAVCEFYKATRNDILSSRRTAALVLPRQIIFYLGRHLTGMSFPQMSRRLGGRDHTTALYAADRINTQIQTDETLKDDIDVLKMKIGAKVMARRFGT